MSRPSLALILSDESSAPVAFAGGWTSLAQFQHEVCAQRSALVARGHMLTGSGAAADDLAQDTIERTLRAGPDRVGPAQLPHWMMAVLRNQFVDEWRVGRRLLSLDPKGCDELPSPDQSPAPGWTAFDGDDVLGAVATLRPGLRQTFELHAFGGHNYQQIARAMDIPIGTVATRLRRARQQIKAVLEGTRGRARTAA